MPLKTDFAEQPTNRVAEAILNYAEEDAKLKIYNPYAVSNYTDRVKFYTSLATAFKKQATAVEKQALAFVHFEIRRMKAKLAPNFINRMLYSDLAMALRRIIRGPNNPAVFYDNLVQRREHQIIQDLNVQALGSSMKQAGFTLEMEGRLRQMLKLNLPEFHFRYADVHNRNAHYLLHFKKIPHSDIYYFERFDAIARPSLEALLNKDPSCLQKTFYFMDKPAINASEAAHLVNGKSIQKSIDGQERWFMVNKLSKGNNLVDFDFKLEDALKRLPIMEKEGTKPYNKIIDRLKHGDNAEVTVNVNGTPTKYFLEVAPIRKELLVLDKNNHFVNLSTVISNRNSTKAVIEVVNDQELNHNHRQTHRV